MGRRQALPPLPQHVESRNRRPGACAVGKAAPGSRTARFRLSSCARDCLQLPHGAIEMRGVALIQVYWSAGLHVEFNAVTQYVDELFAAMTAHGSWRLPGLGEANQRRLHCLRRECGAQRQAISERCLVANTSADPATGSGAGCEGGEGLATQAFDQTHFKSVRRTDRNIESGTRLVALEGEKR